MQDAGTFVGSIDEIAADPDNVEHITGVVKVVNDAQGETEKSVQPKNSATENSEEAKNKAPVKTPPSITALSFADQRQLVHIHTLKQMVANDESLTNMAFEEADYLQAAKIYDNLNSTACFYTTALRLLSKVDWRERVDFEDHIVHQAMIAVARGWTTAVSVRSHFFGKFHLALAMSTLPLQVHGELKSTFDYIVTTVPSPFREKASSKVSFSCRVCGKNAPYHAPTFVILHELSPHALVRDYFNASVPWTEKLLPGSPNDTQPNCDYCASCSSWAIEINATCRLVWLQYPREFHPQAIQYLRLLGKDSFFAGGCSWQYISLVVHQGNDPLYGEHQPSEHFYVLESEGPKCKSFCYNNAVGLHYLDEDKTKDGDRICGLLYRTTDIATKWSGQCTYTTKKAKTSSPQKSEKNKRTRSSRGPRVLLCSRKKGAPKKQAPQHAVGSRIQHAQDFLCS